MAKLRLIGIVCLIWSAGIYVAGNASAQNPQGDRNEVAFIFNWSGLDLTQDYDIIYRLRPPTRKRSNYIEYYCIQISEFDPAVRNKADWVFGPEGNSIIDAARHLAGEIGKAEDCFEIPVSGDSAELAAFVWSVRTHFRSAAGAKIIFYHPETNRLLYVDYQH